MTHRLFWLAVGAGLGISGYRRVNRVIRGFGGSVPHPRRLQLAGLAEVAEFARDVRDGMDQYEEQQRLNIERRRASEGPTLGFHQVSDGGSSSASGAHR